MQIREIAAVFEFVKSEELTFIKVIRDLASRLRRFSQDARQDQTKSCINRKPVSDVQGVLRLLKLTRLMRSSRLAQRCESMSQFLS